MFLLLLLTAVCTHIVAATEDALDAASQGISFETKYETKFLERVHTMISVMLPEVESNFREQIEKGFASKETFNHLLSQLPFEPDNLGTGDCTFNACCSVLILHDAYSSIRDTAAGSQSHPESAGKDPYSILAAIATLTYFKHSDHFYGFISNLIQAICKEMQKQTSQQINIVIDETFKKVLPIGSSQPKFFFDYRKKTLGRMCQFMKTRRALLPYTIDVGEKDDQGLETYYNLLSSETQSPEALDSAAQDKGIPPMQAGISGKAKGKGSKKSETSEGEGSASIRSITGAPASGKSADKAQKGTEKEERAKNKKLAQECLLQFMKIQASGNIVLKRGFKTGKADEVCTITWGALPISSPYGLIQKDENNSMTFIQKDNDANPLIVFSQENDPYAPRLILQIPYIDYPDGESEYLADRKNTVKHDFQRNGRSLEEKLDCHAVTANFHTAINFNTWFSAQK